jgi:hypothetical protein
MFTSVCGIAHSAIRGGGSCGGVRPFSSRFLKGTQNTQQGIHGGVLVTKTRMHDIVS